MPTADRRHDPVFMDEPPLTDDEIRYIKARRAISLRERNAVDALIASLREQREFEEALKARPQPTGEPAL